jgi:membrane protein insertase Oxa1/YidC/SpoIIIJ
MLFSFRNGLRTHSLRPAYSVSPLAIRPRSRNVSTIETAAPNLDLHLTPIYAIISDVFSVAHSYGTPWVLAIPITTVALKFFTMRWTHFRIQKARMDSHMVKPFQIAFNNITKHHSAIPSDRRKEFLFWMKYWEQCAKTRYRVTSFSTFGPISLQIGIWLLVTDCLRYMIGAPLGILSRIYPEFIAPVNPVYLLDPTLATEGIPLICSSLASPDPTVILPITLATVVFFNMKRSASPLLQSLGQRSPIQAKIAQYIPHTVLLTMPFVISQIPAGLILYWTSSALSGMFINRMLSAKYPTRKMPSACTQGFDETRPLPLWLLDAKSGQSSNKRAR